LHHLQYQIDPFDWNLLNGDWLDNDSLENQEDQILVEFDTLFTQNSPGSLPGSMGLEPPATGDAFFQRQNSIGSLSGSISLEPPAKKNKK